MACFRSCCQLAFRRWCPRSRLRPHLPIVHILHLSLHMFTSHLNQRTDYPQAFRRLPPFHRPLQHHLPLRPFNLPSRSHIVNRRRLPSRLPPHRPWYYFRIHDPRPLRRARHAPPLRRLIPLQRQAVRPFRFLRSLHQVSDRSKSQPCLPHTSQVRRRRWHRWKLQVHPRIRPSSTERRRDTICKRCSCRVLECNCMAPCL